MGVQSKSLDHQEVHASVSYIDSLRRYPSQAKRQTSPGQESPTAGNRQTWVPHVGEEPDQALAPGGSIMTEARDHGGGLHRMDTDLPLGRIVPPDFTQWSPNLQYFK